MEHYRCSTISSRKEAKTNPEPVKEEKVCECKRGNIVFDENRGAFVCSNCGLVHSEHHIDRGPDWRAFSAEQKKRRKRTGAPMTYMIHDKGLSTMIDWKDRDIYGNKIPAKLRSQIYRLRKWQSRIRVSNSTERNLTFALSELERMASNLDLKKNLREAAAKIYRDAVEKHLIQGRSIEGVSAASLYAACRMFRAPITLNEIADIARVDKREVGRSFRFIIKELKLHLTPMKAIHFLNRFISELNLSNECQQIAKEILRNAEKYGLTSGRGPTGLCGASIYAALKELEEKCTQKRIAEISQVTEVTIRNIYKFWKKKKLI
ncbi:MAG: transcription initiation factor IIB [Promethearchaeota archaeon]|nr:MAG: transcription initiation factor IIB [Candidatus Lokiarchaeota archaeon]